jgi:hypothetical protein
LAGPAGPSMHMLVWVRSGEGVRLSGRAWGGTGSRASMRQAHGMALRVFAVPWKGTAGSLYSGRVSRDRIQENVHLVQRLVWTVRVGRTSSRRPGFSRVPFGSHRMGPGKSKDRVGTSLGNVGNMITGRKVDATHHRHPSPVHPGNPPDPSGSAGKPGRTGLGPDRIFQRRRTPQATPPSWHSVVVGPTC